MNLSPGICSYKEEWKSINFKKHVLFWKGFGINHWIKTGQMSTGF